MHASANELNTYSYLPYAILRCGETLFGRRRPNCASTLFVLVVQ
jgi:hypothetical protein